MSYSRATVRSLPSSLAFLAATALFTPAAVAQPGGPINPQPTPPGNPPPANYLTDGRVLLGHILFFEEQVSSTRTVACATCHLPEFGGTDPRAQVFHPGSLSGPADDANGSAGVIRNTPAGAYTPSPTFGLEPQGTRRKAPAVPNSAVFELLLWDGGAGPAFTEGSPPTAVPGLHIHAALEAQSVGPPINDVEMAHIGATWADVEARLASVTPLALASNVPARLLSFINAHGGSYAAMFDAAFPPATVWGQTAPGPGVTRRRFAMAVATYQRTLLPQQAPVLSGNLGGPESLAAWGGFLFEGGPNFQAAGRANCIECHADEGSRKTDNDFHNIGLVPPAVDPGRFAVTQDPADLGKFKTPSLFNVALQRQFFHNGRFETLEEVVDHYIAGGNPDIPGNELVPLSLKDPSGAVNNAFGRAALVAYLKKFTDPRLEVQPTQLQAPFDRPLLYTESSRVPAGIGAGTAGTSLPAMIAIEPPLATNPNFSLGIKDAPGGAFAELWIDVAHVPGGVPLGGSGPLVYPAQTSSMTVTGMVLGGSGVGQGFGTVVQNLPSIPAMIGATRYAQWIVYDSDAPNQVSASDAVQYTFF